MPDSTVYLVTRYGDRVLFAHTDEALATEFAQVTADRAKVAEPHAATPHLLVTTWLNGLPVNVSHVYAK